MIETPPGGFKQELKGKQVQLISMHYQRLRYFEEQKTPQHGVWTDVCTRSFHLLPCPL